jgi:hypothetical protein
VDTELDPAEDVDIDRWSLRGEGDLIEMSESLLGDRH